MKQLLTVAIALAFILAGCGGSHHSVYGVEGDTITSRAEFLTLIDYGDWTACEIRAPWTDSATVGKYALVPAEVSGVNLPDGYSVVRTPVADAIVMSSVFTSAICELGGVRTIRGVADGSYFSPDDTIAKLVADGTIVDVGSSMAPLIEKVVDVSPDVLMMSLYAGDSSMGLGRLGIPIIWMADYFEKNPLARAEWILLYGELLGNRPLAQDIFNSTREKYNSIVEKTAAVGVRPTVITEKPMSAVWYVPAGESYIANMITDAGGHYLWSDLPGSESVSLDEAAVIDRGADARFWLVKDIRNLNPDAFIREMPRAVAFNAFPRNVFCCNTIATPYYNAVAFHPELVVADMAAIFHPDLFPDHKFLFYKPLE